MRTGATSAATALLAVLVACGSPGPDELGGSSGPSSLSSPSTAPSASTDSTRPGQDPAAAAEVDPEGARAALAEAVAIVRDEGVTAFRADTTFQGRLTTSTTGFSSADGWQSTTDFYELETGERSDDVLRTVSTGTTQWMQVGWTDERAGCWLTLGPRQVPLGILAMRAEEPVYVSIVGDLTASDFGDESRTTIRGTTGLATASQLVNGDILERVGLEPAGFAGTRLPVLMGYDGRRLSGLGVAGVDLVAAFEDLGASLSPAERGALGGSNHVVNYPPPPSTLRITAPPAELQFSTSSDGCA